MKEETYSIAADTVKHIIKSIINKDRLENKGNMENVISILSTSLNRDHVSALMEMILSKDVHIPLAVGDYVKAKPPAYHEGDKFEWDVLMDNGLATEDKYVYGIITEDGSWSSEFDPYSHKMKVDLLYYDKELIKDNYSITTFSLQKVSKEDIPYFKQVEKPAQRNLLDLIKEEEEKLQNEL
tara:strand:- start:913 stop:1458 length:546 start_codon:yes stop_codon:yes gene_type:complete